MVIVMLGRVGAFSFFHLSVVCMLTCRGLWDIGLMSVWVYGDTEIRRYRDIEILGV